MGRKNSRLPAYESDIPPAPITVTRRRLETPKERDSRVDAELSRKRQRNEKRIAGRVASAVDWSTCCIPGCGTTITPMAAFYRDASQQLPLCTYHETLVSLQANPWIRDKDHEDMRRLMARRYVEEEHTRFERQDIIEENDGASQGQIYVIRQGGLIKVGWSSKLRSRLKSYGAGVEILAHYPATRAEETGLHRSLRPYLARGREWYQDCKLLADVVDGIIKRHGAPTVFPYWTEPKPAQSARPKGFPA
jgi:hypothetical protein